LVAFGRKGLRRFQRFGHVDDLTLGSIIGTLLAEPFATSGAGAAVAGVCDEASCSIAAVT